MRQTATKKPSRNDPCWCGSGKKYKKCHLAQERGGGGFILANTGFKNPFKKAAGNKIKRIALRSQEQIEGIRRAAQLTRAILTGLEEIVRAGVSTEEIDQWIHDYTLDHGGTPATLGYKGYPKSSCISINEVVCHGIPDARKLRSGEIVNVDVTTILDGYYGDASSMYLVGEVSPEARRLVEVTKECLDIGVATVRPGNTVGDIGHAIQTHAETAGFSVVRQFVGHGIGLRFHEPLQVPHFGHPNKGPALLPGMVFTIEPMINAGHFEVEILDDNWTAVTKDGSLSAQWEHTVAVTEDGVDVLTA